MRTMKCFGYARVSGEDQAREGVSLDVQAEKIRLYVELHGLELVELVTDAGESAKTLDRPGLARVLAGLDDGTAEGVVIAKLDRLTRSLADWSSLIDRYFGERARPPRRLLSVQDSIDTRTAAGRMMLNILMTVAQWEREAIVERTQAALDHKRRKGERCGSVPFGFDLAEDGRTLLVNSEEQGGLALIRRWHAEHVPLRRIAGQLDELGIRPKTGKPRWSHGTIQRILQRPT